MSASRSHLRVVQPAAPWVDANKDDAAAICRAEELVRAGLRAAAGKHTRNAQAAVAQADGSRDGPQKARLMAYALDEYRWPASHA
jgi:hypothetical protein